MHTCKHTHTESSDQPSCCAFVYWRYCSSWLKIGNPSRPLSLRFLPVYRWLSVLTSSFFHLSVSFCLSISLLGSELVKIKYRCDLSLQISPPSCSVAASVSSPSMSLWKNRLHYWSLSLCPSNFCKSLSQEEN